jgi:hypothetical protein
MLKLHAHRSPIALEFYREHQSFRMRESFAVRTDLNSGILCSCLHDRFLGYELSIFSHRFHFEDSARTGGLRQTVFHRGRQRGQPVSPPRSPGSELVRLLKYLFRDH